MNINKGLPPVGRVLAGWYIKAFLPSGSSPGASDESYPGHTYAQSSIQSGMEELTATHGPQAAADLYEPGTSRVNVAVAIALHHEENPCAITEALIQWVAVINGVGGGEQNHVPLLTINRDYTVRFSQCGTVIPTIINYPPSLPPFFRILDAVIRARTDIELDDFGTFLIGWLASCGMPPSPTLEYVLPELPLATIARSVVRWIQLQSVSSNASSASSGFRSARSLATQALMSIPANTIVIRPDLVSIYMGPFNNRYISAIDRFIPDRSANRDIPTEFVQSLEALAKAKPAEDDGEGPEEDTDSNAYNPADDKSVADTVIAKGGKSNVNHNAIDTGNGKRDDTIDLLPLISGKEGANAFYYRRAILSLCDALENDPDANVSADARKTLDLMCKYYLFTADLTKIKEVMSSCGLDKLLSPVASSV